MGRLGWDGWKRGLDGGEGRYRLRVSLKVTAVEFAVMGQVVVVEEVSTAKVTFVWVVAFAVRGVWPM